LYLRFLPMTNNVSGRLVKPSPDLCSLRSVLYGIGRLRRAAASSSARQYILLPNTTVGIPAQWFSRYSSRDVLSIG